MSHKYDMVVDHSNSSKITGLGWGSSTVVKVFAMLVADLTATMVLEHH